MMRCIHNVFIFSILILTPGVLVSQILTVISTADSGPGTLRVALDTANIRIGPDTIRFNLPKSDSGFNGMEGVWYIKPDTFFSYITDSDLVIDGTSQSNYLNEDSNPYGPEIVISGENEGSFSSCLNITGQGIEIYNLTINKFKGAGINVTLNGSVVVSGCYIGTDYSGMSAAGNGDGIVLGYKSGHSHIGPTDYYSFGNIISGNNRIGLFMVDSSMFNVVVANYIGLNRDHSGVLGNFLRGIDLSRSANYNEVLGNYIGGNPEGIFINDSKENLVANNFIGTDESGQMDLGNANAGIYLYTDANHNRIIGNHIGYGGIYGIYNDGQKTISNLFSRNNFFQNNFADIENINGGNLELNPPVITSASSTSITGHGSAGQTVEIYVDYGIEGIRFLDTVLVDPQGNFLMDFREPVLEPLDLLSLAIDTSGNTSEFSNPYLVTASYDYLPEEPAVLFQNMPNPADQFTSIHYFIDRPGMIRITLIDAIGLDKYQLVNAWHKPGNYMYELKCADLTSGLYIYSLWIGNTLFARHKMTVIH